jgi:hypothetical protein
MASASWNHGRIEKAIAMKGKEVVYIEDGENHIVLDYDGIDDLINQLKDLKNEWDLIVGG